MIASAGIIDPEEEHAVDGHGHVIAGDDLLLGDVHREDAGIDHPKLVDQGDDHEETGPLDRVKFAQAKDDRLLPLGGQPDRRRDDDVEEQPRQREDDGRRHVILADRGCHRHSQKEEHNEHQPRDVVDHRICLYVRFDERSPDGRRPD